MAQLVIKKLVNQELIIEDATVDEDGNYVVDVDDSVAEVRGYFTQLGVDGERVKTKADVDAERVRRRKRGLRKTQPDQSNQSKKGK
jgi:hypothetical protein